MKRISSMFLVLAVAFASFATAQSPEARGLEIARAADKADEGFQSSSAKLTMVLRNKRGQEGRRLLNSQTLEQSADGDKSLIVFNSPGYVKGTATLTFSHKEGSDDQWLYLPAIKRVKRISSDNKSGPFMGSEFAYEDLSSQEVEKYTYKFLRAEDLDGDKGYVVERDPVDTKSGYTRQVVWYNASKGYRIEKIEFYDRKNVLLKTLSYSQYEQYLGKFWRAGNMRMVNHQTQKETVLIFEDYAFRIGLSEADFNQNSLRRFGG